MNDSVSKIARGIHNRERTAEVLPLGKYVGAPTTLAAITEHIAQVCQRRNILRVRAEEIRVAVAKHREIKSAEYAELGKVRTDKGSIVDELGDQKRRVLLERSVNAFAREKRAQSADERVKLRREIDTLAAKLAPMRDSWSEATSMLHRATLGDRRRIDYYATMSTVGPRALEVSLADAIAMNNRPLAAAILDRLDALPDESKKMVRFSRQQAAETMMAEELRQARAAFAMLDIAVAEADMEQAAAEGKRAFADAKIHVGKLKRTLAGLIPGSNSDEGDTDAPRILSDDDWQKRLDAKYPAAPKSEPKTEMPKPFISDDEWNALVESATVRDE